MELYAAVRLAVVEEGPSHREAGRRFGFDRRRVKKMLSYLAPPGYRRTKPVKRPKLDGFTGIIDGILEAERTPDVPRKQRHTGLPLLVHRHKLRTEAEYRDGSLLSFRRAGAPAPEAHEIKTGTGTPPRRRARNRERRREWGGERPIPYSVQKDRISVANVGLSFSIASAITCRSSLII